MENWLCWIVHETVWLVVCLSHLAEEDCAKCEPPLAVPWEELFIFIQGEGKEGGVDCLVCLMAKPAWNTFVGKLEIQQNPQIHFFLAFK